MDPTTWPTPRDGFIFGTGELSVLREALDADDDTVADLAETFGRRFTTTRTRLLRLRALPGTRTARTTP